MPTLVGSRSDIALLRTLSISMPSPLALIAFEEDIAAEYWQ
jgi:hypothetical protein